MAPLVSADSHIIEPPHLWERWLDPAFRDRAPRLVKDDEGGDAWLYNDGGAPAPLGLVTMTRNQPRESLRWGGARYDTINRGNYDGPARLNEMLEDGVVAEVIYPPQRTMRHFMQGTEDAFHQAGIRAYNDWLFKEFCAADTDRLIGIAQMPGTGIDAALEELYRCEQLGCRGVVLSAWPSGHPTIGADDDRFFAECERLGLPISIHIGLAARAKVAAKPKTPLEEKAARGEGTGARQVSVLSAAGLDSMPLIVGELVLAGVHDRFPNLRFVSVEAGIGWVPYFFEQLDDRYQRNRTWAKVALQRRPSEYIGTNWRFTFVQDHYGVRNRHAVGIESCLWSTDYPHHGCDWPHSRQVVDDMFAHVPEAEKHQVTFGNVQELYNLRLAEELLSPRAA